jgi:hypothetical protein
LRTTCEFTLTIEPPRWCFMCGSAAWISLSEPNRLTSKVLRQSSRFAVSTGPMTPGTYALLMSPSIRPNASIDCATSLSQSLTSAMSVGTLRTGVSIRDP